MENDIYLKQAYVNDPIFQKELQEIHPETKFLMNRLLSDIEDKYDVKNK